MACRICGRQSCTESFHTISEQLDFENKTGRFSPEDVESDRDQGIATREQEEAEDE